MTGAIPAEMPNGAAFISRLAQSIMDVILHLGAHRTATTTFQHYMRGQAALLETHKTGYWGPARTRKTIFPGLFRSTAVTSRRHPARRAEGRIRMMTQEAEERGLQQLLVSDENLIGSCAHNLRYMALYPAIGDRMARVNAAFEGRITRVLLSIRSQDLWWSSCAALAVSRGHSVPGARRCTAIANSRRGWRDVITDLACAVPDASIIVQPFEQAPGQSDVTFALATGISGDPDQSALWRSRSPTARELRLALLDQGADPDQIPDTVSRWQPFTTRDCAQLRENYADDLHWLTAGADGLATLTEDTFRKRAGTSLPPEQMTKGQGHDDRQGHMAQHRRS